MSEILPSYFGERKLFTNQTAQLKMHILMHIHTHTSAILCEVPLLNLTARNDVIKSF